MKITFIKTYGLSSVGDTIDAMDGVATELVRRGVAVEGDGLPVADDVDDVDDADTDDEQSSSPVGQNKMIKRRHVKRKAAIHGQ